MQVLKYIQTKLNDDLFAATQETCLALCRVQDVAKKSKDKTYVLCACSKSPNATFFNILMNIILLSSLSKS